MTVSPDSKHNTAHVDKSDKNMSITVKAKSVSTMMKVVVEVEFKVVENLSTMHLTDEQVYFNYMGMNHDNFSSVLNLRIY
jgi:DNA polymerase III sliding clamp (beta) subunit (PCNA family)